MPRFQIALRALLISFVFFPLGAIRPRTCTAQDPCSGFQKIIDNLQTQLAKAQANLDEQICQGSARLECTKRIQSLQSQIQEERKALKDCQDKQNPQKPMAQGTFRPRYYLITILYAPPGNLSEASYASGSSTGAKSEITTTNAGGFSIQESSTFIDIGFGFQIGSKDGHSLETKKETTQTLSLQSQADALNHLKDMFYIWTNPQVDLQQTAGNSATVSLRARDGEAVTIVNLTAEELQDPTKIPSTKKQALSNLKSEDYQAILSFDPYVTGTAIAPSRYFKVGTLQIDGPDQTGDPISGQGIKISTEEIAGIISGSTDKIDLSVLVGIEIDFIGKAGLKVGGTYEWEYDKSKEDTTGQTQEIELKLASSTVGYHDVIDVYFDSVFQSFSYASRTAGLIKAEASALSGTVTDNSGKPVMNERVFVTLPDGTKRTVLTNARGIYRVFDVPKNSIATIQFGTLKRQAKVGSKKAQALNFRKR